MFEQFVDHLRRHKSLERALDPTSFVVSTGRAHTVTFSAEDCAGNRSAPETFGWTQLSATPTPTPTGTGVVTTPQPTQAPMVIMLSADYADLALMASRVGAPAQTLRCMAAGGGSAPYDVAIEVLDPLGATTFYSLTTDESGNCTFGPAQAGDPEFGTTAIGQWTGRAFSGGSSSNSVVWFVSWFRVHERP